MDKFIVRYNAYRGDVSVPCSILYKGSKHGNLRPEIVAWSITYPAEFSVEDGVEKFTTKINGKRYVAFADRRDDTRYYMQRYGEVPEWLQA